jgi:polyhydroxybutyrate depolymerase
MSIAAIAPVAATMLSDYAAPSPVSVFHLHGSADTSGRLDCDPGEGVAEVDGPPVADVIEFWRTTDRCVEPTEVVAGQLRRSVSGCDDGRSVELVVVDGAGNQWPGSEMRRPATDPPLPGLDATAEIWRFVDAHPRPD